MPTIGEVYNPLIEARNNPELFTKLINDTAELIMLHNPTKCKTLEDGITAVKRNLDYYCQYFDNKTILEVKKAMGFSNHWVALNGMKIQNVY